MGFKDTLIKSITAVVCVIAICVTATIGTNKICEAKTQAAKGGSGTSSSSDSSVQTDSTNASGETITDANGEAVTNANGETVTDTSANASTDAGGTTAQAASSNGTTAKSSSSSTSSQPKTAAEIISYYNTATAKVVSSKAGYAKTRVTDNESVQANALVKQFNTLIYKFMGIGADNKYSANVTKGNWGDKAFFFASKLTASDVTSAVCNASNGSYVITMKLKNGSSSADKSNPTTAPNSSLDKSGICVGTEDKGYFDHKTASVIYDAIQGTFASASVNESYSGATVKATINASSGQITNLVVEWNISVSIKIGTTATATGVSHVTYSGFSY